VTTDVASSEVCGKFMDLRPLLELLEREHVSGGQMTRALLQEAVADWPTNSPGAMRVIKRLQASDALGLAIAALRLLISNENSAEERSRGLQYIASLVTSGDLLPRILLDDRVLSSHAAATLAPKVAAVHPLLDVHLVGLVVANGGSEGGVATSALVLRALAIASTISDCSWLAPSLVQLLRHSCARVRSKAALLLGRANRNLPRIENLLASPDSRLRANAVESLWGDGRHEVLRMLKKASHDECGRVMVNALLGLCKAGDMEAHSRLLDMAENDNPALRCGAAWAMGESSDREFSAALETLAHDADVKVRAMAEKSREKLNAPDPAVQLNLKTAQVDSGSVQKTIPTVPKKGLSYVRIN
jgi:HEAT repeat protein